MIRVARSACADAEHCDEDSLDVFAQLLAMVDAGELTAPLLVVLSIRSSELDVEQVEPFKKWLQHEHVERLDMGPLDHGAAAEHVPRLEWNPR